jgi:SAM-dependent methyltransferase
MPQAAVDTNRRFYGDLWAASRLVGPERFNTWPVLSRLAATATARLELGPGLRPRLPVAGTCVVDVSAEAAALLRRAGARAIQADVTALPFPGGCFDLVCAFDVVEHVADDARIFRELARVTRAGAAVVLSVPLHPERWSAFDAVVGHVRRYAPSALRAVLAAHGLAVESSAVFGMEPRSRWLLDLAAWGLTHRPARAMRWYDAVIMPIGLRLQRRLALVPGLVDTAGVGEILLVCRRVPSGDGP